MKNNDVAHQVARSCSSYSYRDTWEQHTHNSTTNSTYSICITNIQKRVSDRQGSASVERAHCTLKPPMNQEKKKSQQVVMPSILLNPFLAPIAEVHQMPCPCDLYDTVLRTATRQANQAPRSTVTDRMACHRSHLLCCSTACPLPSSSIIALIFHATAGTNVTCPTARAAPAAYHAQLSLARRKGPYFRTLARHVTAVTVMGSRTRSTSWISKTFFHHRGRMALDSLSRSGWAKVEYMTC